VRLLRAACVVGATLLLCHEAHAQKYSINPGVRLAYTLDHGFTMGFEISALLSIDDGNRPKDFNVVGPNVGAVLDLDWIFGEKNFVRIGLDGEVTVLFGGVTLGPSLMLGEGSEHLGFESSIFASFGLPLNDFGCKDTAIGPLVTAYYRLALFKDLGLVHELGGLAKVFFLKGRLYCD
jgi:hypothetical protein